MNEFLKVFGAFTIADVLTFLLALLALYGAIKWTVKKIRTAMRKIDEINSKLDSIEELKAQLEANRKGTVVMLRLRIRQNCLYVKNRKTVTPSKLDAINMLFSAYAEMGDNGQFETTRKMVEEVNRLPVVEEED